MKMNFLGRPAWPQLPRALQEIVDLRESAYYAPDPTPLLIALATYTAFIIPGEPPLWTMMVGGPSGGKTSTLDPLKLLPSVHFRSTITAPGLLSGSSTKNRIKGATGGLLREIGDEGFLGLKDFSSMLSMPRVAQREVLAAFREIYDGHWTRALGVDGGRSISWQGKVGLIAACTTAIDEHAHVMASMGERFIHYRYPQLDSNEQEEMAAKAADNCDAITENKQQLADRARDFFAHLAIPSHTPELDLEAAHFIEGLATLVARCRSAITRNSYTREIENVHAYEDPARLAGQLRRLEAGLSVIGVPAPWRFRIVRKVAIDCIPPVRRLVLEQLSQSPPHRQFNLKSLAAAVGYPKTTTWRAVDDLKAHGVVQYLAGKSDGQSAEEKVDNSGSWSLREEWCERFFRFPKSTKG